MNRRRSLGVTQPLRANFAMARGAIDVANTIIKNAPINNRAPMRGCIVH
jgi:hypothetical protein